MAEERDWAYGPAKWIAVGLIGGASIAGMTWTIAQKYPPAPRAVVLQPPPAAAQPQVVHQPVPSPRATPEVVPEAVKPTAPAATPTSAPPENILDQIAEQPSIITVEAPAATPPPTPPPPRQPTPTPSFARIININTASSAELQLLSGIGPALAGRIVEYRQANGPFRTVDELMNVRGIGPKTLENVRPRVRVD